MRFVISGRRPLQGTVCAGPAKNALLPALAATLLTPEPVVLAPVTRMSDVAAMVELLVALGAVVTWGSGEAGPEIAVRAPGPLASDAPDEAVGRMRASVLVLGPLLVRCGRACLADPGGCAIGTRPIDLHLLAMRALGAEVRPAGRRVELRAPHGLRGAEIRLPYPSHTATENALLAACGARGESVIVGAAREPEVSDLARLLCAMGADVQGAGGPAIRVRPPRGGLHGARHRVIPDRIEAGTLLLAGAVATAAGAAGAGTGVTVVGADPLHLEALLAKLRASGFRAEAEGGGVRLRGAAGPPRAVDIRTQPHPGFPTDLQPQWSVLAALAGGSTLIEETIFDRRLEHLHALVQMGADARLYGPRFAVLAGPARLAGAAVRAADLRGGAALVLAGLAAEGRTEVAGGEHVARGYADLAGKLRALGADIEAVEDGEAAEAAPRGTAVEAVGVGGRGA